MSINKSQGQTFKKVGIYLPTPVFSHGQLYVAFSRTTSFANVIVKIEDNFNNKQYTAIKNDIKKFYTRNVVYEQLIKE